MEKNQLKKEELLDEKPPVCFITDEVNIPIAETTAIVVTSVVYYLVFRMIRELNPAFILGMVTFIAASGSGAMLSELDYAGSPFSQSLSGRSISFFSSFHLRLFGHPIRVVSIFRSRVSILQKRLYSGFLACMPVVFI